MIRALRLGTVVLPILLAGCTATDERAAEPAAAAAVPVPVGFRIALTGATGPVLAEDGSGALELEGAGADEPLSLGFENGSLAVHGLAPGRYDVARLGPLQCRGLTFEVGTRPRYIGTLRAEVVRTDYLVALMQSAVADPADVAALAEHADVGTEAVDARPLAVTEAAPCFVGEHGPATTWDDLTLEEKIILGVGVAGLCAISLAAGGFCHF